MYGAEPNPFFAFDDVEGYCHPLAIALTNGRLDVAKILVQAGAAWETRSTELLKELTYKRQYDTSDDSKSDQEDLTYLTASNGNPSFIRPSRNPQNKSELSSDLTSHNIS